MCDCKPRYDSKEHKEKAERWELTANRFQYVLSLRTEYLHGRKHFYRPVSSLYACSGMTKISDWTKEYNPTKNMSNFRNDMLCRLELDSSKKVTNCLPVQDGIRHLEEHELEFWMLACDVFSLIDELSYRRGLIVAAKRISQSEDEFVIRLKQQISNSEDYLLCLILNLGDIAEKDKRLQPDWLQIQQDYKQIPKIIDKFVADTQEKVIEAEAVAVN